MIATTPAVDVLGSLAVATPRGRTITIDGRGRHVRIRVPLFAVAEAGGGRARRSTSALRTAADRLGLVVDVRLAGLLGARFAPRRSAGLVSRLLGCAPFRLVLFPA